MSTTNMPPRLLWTEAARFLGLSPRMIEKHRTYATGPLYRRLGGHVVYAIDDLLAWAQTGVHTGNSDIVPEAPRPAKPQTAYEPYRLSRS